MKGTGMRVIICIESCEPYTIGPFGVGSWVGTGITAKECEKYYVNTCSSRKHYYVASENYGLGNSAHTHPSFMGLYESKYFIELADYRETQIDSILSD